jgi:hypothetical protein
MKTMTLPYPFSIMFPGAAGNWQTFDSHLFSPNVSVNFAGNANIEREVTSDVASYGTQIGWLNEVVMALAAAAPDAIKGDRDAAGALKNLGDAAEKIAEIKRRRGANALDSARDALSRLGAEDKHAYGRLVRSLNPDKPLESG